MRKYISILVVALVALFMATSCQLESGTEPNPNKANQLLWRRVETALNGQYEHAQMVVWLNDYMIGEVWSETYKPIEVSENEGVYTFSYTMSGDYYATTYRINTGGKKLNEGGEWIVYVKYGAYMEFAKVGVVKGVVGENTKFSIECEVSHQTPHYNALQSEVEYLFNDVEEMYEFTFMECKGISTDTNNASNSMEYIIEFEATELLVYTDKTLWSGKIDILYKDNMEGTERNVTAEIERRFVTFI